MEGASVRGMIEISYENGQINRDWVKKYYFQKIRRERNYVL